MDKTRLAELFKRDGEKKFTMNMVNLINEGKITPQEFSVKALWEATGKPDLNKYRIIESRSYSEEEFQEAMDSSAFPTITGTLINRVVQDAYDKAYGVADALVTVLPSSLREETIVGFADDYAMQEVDEAMPYQEGSITEKYHRIKNRKFGRIISLTEEMIKFDQTGQMLMRAAQIGEAARVKKERIILDAVLGLVNTGEYAAWRPAGTATTLYSNTSTDPYSGSTFDNLATDALSDETDIDAAMALFAQAKDENGDAIIVTPDTILTGLSRAAIAQKILRSGMNVEKTVPTGTYNMFSGMFNILATPFIDQLVGAGYWWLGAFRKQFVYTQVFPLQVMAAKAGNEKEFENDIVARFKARLMGGCGAVSNRYVVKQGQ